MFGVSHGGMQPEFKGPFGPLCSFSLPIGRPYRTPCLDTLNLPSSPGATHRDCRACNYFLNTSDRGFALPS